MRSAYTVAMRVPPHSVARFYVFVHIGACNISFPNSLAISKDYTNFAGMMNTTIYNKGGKIQGNVAFLASFNVLYLAVSLEKLHTHTHPLQT